MYTELIILSMRIFSEQRIQIGETIIIAQLSHFYVSFRKQNLFVSSSCMIVSQHNSLQSFQFYFAFNNVYFWVFVFQ